MSMQIGGIAAPNLHKPAANIKERFAECLHYQSMTLAVALLKALRNPLHSLLAATHRRGYRHHHRDQNLNLLAPKYVFSVIG
jgi:hypothetical protein